MNCSNLVNEVMALAEGQSKQTKLCSHPELITELRSRVPEPGDHYIKAVTVVVGPGKKIDKHEHPQHTILFYANPSAPILINDEEYWPRVGEFLYLKPNTPHAVPKNTSAEPRVSVAMLVNADKGT